MSIIFRENVPLKNYSNYKIGGPARYFFEFGTAEELKAVLEAAKERDLRFFILGGGTNLLISDAGFDGLILKPAAGTLSRAGSDVTVGAGVPMEHLLNFAASEGLSGLEWAGGLPGTLGGAIRGNAGAFGGEIKDSVASVKSLDADTLQVVERANSECRFAYRSSVFKEKQGREIVLEAVLALRSGKSDEIRKATKEKIDYRFLRHPMEHPNIGSIFKNVPAERMGVGASGSLAGAGEKEVTIKGVLYRIPVKADPFPVVPAAYLISEAGLKGLAHGGAMVSSKHPNFIVNTGGAAAADVKHLISAVKNAVGEKFGVELEKEVEFLD
ncbi:UDP-N-acetylmuramate dehydrogenase [Candidatus Parcubacteria bacterium]|nr:MAG: UDP-N-acetylmuramate dehydrogenase [Candidatus Parcubacteria bacterium]